MCRKLGLAAMVISAVRLWSCGVASGAEGLTSEQVMRKCADTYKAMKTYYEESDFSKVTDLKGQHSEETNRVITAFKRPSTLQIRVTDKNAVTFNFDNGTLTVYNAATNQYMKQEKVTLQQIANSLEYPVPATAVSDDPYAYMMEEVTKVGDLKTVEFDGRKVYAVELTAGEGIAATNYFDMSRFYLVGVKVDVSLPAERGGGKRVVVMTAKKVLIDELPMDASGKPVDVFAFSTPAEAKEFKPEQIDAQTLALKGKPAPDWTLKDLAGRDVHLADLKGKVVLIDFWATWCSPCLEELPVLSKFAGDYKDKPFAYYAIDDGEAPEQISEFVKGLDYAVPALVGAGTTAGQDYKIVALPTLFIVDKKGVISEVFVGLTPVEKIRPVVDKLLAEPAQ